MSSIEGGRWVSQRKYLWCPSVGFQCFSAKICCALSMPLSITLITPFAACLILNFFNLNQERTRVHPLLPRCKGGVTPQLTWRALILHQGEQGQKWVGLNNNLSNGKSLHSIFWRCCHLCHAPFVEVKTLGCFCLCSGHGWGICWCSGCEPRVGKSRLFPDNGSTILTCASAQLEVLPQRSWRDH